MIVSHRTYAPNLQQPRHAHDSMSVTLVLAGSIAERVGEVEEIGRPLSLVIKPVDVEHANRFGHERVRTLQIELSAQEAGELARAHASMRHWQWRHHGVPVRAFVRLARALQQPNGLTSVELASIEALASIDSSPVASGDPPRVIRLLMSRLNDELCAPSVRDLAADAALHPVYLARLFRRYVGSTIGQYVRRNRVRQAITRISTHGDALSTVAHASGFADHAHMCRVFRDETGLTPSEYRAVIS